jgi:hypothetical protein
MQRGVLENPYRLNSGISQLHGHLQYGALRRWIAEQGVASRALLIRWQ